MSAQEIMVLANVISFIGNALFTSSALFKSKKRIIAFQTGCHLLNSVAWTIQGAYAGLSQDASCFFKNIVLLFVDDSKKLLKLVINIFFIIVALSLGIILNVLLSNNVWYGYLPITGMFLYSSAAAYVFWKEGLSKNKVELLLKCLLIVNGVCQCIYGIMVQVYASTIFNSITIVLSIYSIIRISILIKKEKQNKQIEDDFENA